MRQMNFKSGFRFFNLAIFACFGALLTINAAAQTLRADYQFQNMRSSSVAGAPDLTDIAGGNTFTDEKVR